MLLNLFRKEKNSVLFGTDSFWEGVDVQGRNLEMVVITRLPFRVPTEPIHKARAEHITANGGDPFMEYTVPQAVIKLKQGFGRLIKSKDDRESLMLDSRVLSRATAGFFSGPFRRPVSLRVAAKRFSGRWKLFQECAYVRF
jgi:ATP-dependent DNA helicase DinG